MAGGCVRGRPCMTFLSLSWLFNPSLPHFMISLIFIGGLTISKSRLSKIFKTWQYLKLFGLWERPRGQNRIQCNLDLVTLCELVTVFAETKSVGKLRLHCNFLFEMQDKNIIVRYQLTSSYLEKKRKTCKEFVLYTFLLIYTINFSSISNPLLP